eukprot:Awhi_evm1s9925
MCSLLIQLIVTVASFNSGIKAASLASGNGQDKANALPHYYLNSMSIHRRDLGGSCSSDYDYWTLTCPVKSNDCLSGYHANAFYQDGECNCVCDQNSSRRRDTDVKTGPKPIQRSVDNAKVTFRDRRDLGGSCSSDYDYWSFTCPVKTNNCLSGYHANAFYQDGQCNCVCDQNGSRRREPEVKIGLKRPQETLDLRNRRGIGGSCSSNYDYWTLSCPVDSDNCLPGYHPNAHYDDSQCDCACVKDDSRRRDIETNTGHKQLILQEKIDPAKVTIASRNRRATGGSCSSNYDYWTFSCPVDSDNCLPGYHPNAHYDDSQCDCQCEPNSSRRRDIETNTDQK